MVGEGLVVSGTVDRLLVRRTGSLLADFKTGRRVAGRRSPTSPPAHLRQMAAYRDALRVIFPGRRIEAKLLYTAAPDPPRRCRDALLARTSAPAGG